MNKKKILIIDDQKDLLTLLKNIFDHHNFETHIALDGQQGIDMTKELNPDFILLDIKMSNKDGIEVLKELRAIPDFKKTPIVVLSAKGQLHEINEGIKAGASSYLCKPVVLQNIINKIDEFLPK